MKGNENGAYMINSAASNKFSENVGKAMIRSHRGGSWDTYLQFWTSLDSNIPQMRMQIDGNGNVGIGTDQADGKLTVQGDVNIGGTGNALLKVRHIEGKSNTGIGSDNLYLNWISGQNVQVGRFDPNGGTPKSDLYVDGSVGIGTQTPETPLTIKAFDSELGNQDRSSNEGAVIQLQSYNGDSESSVRFVPDLYSVSLYNKTTDNSDYNLIADFSQFGTTLSNGLTIEERNNGQYVKTFFRADESELSYNDNFKVTNEGIVTTRKIKLSLSAWKDCVFKPQYPLMNLNELQKYITENEHLPGVISEKDVLENGIDVGENQAVLLQKIEELTLYIIQLNAEIEKLKSK
jgi:hypothetical protein